MKLVIEQGQTYLTGTYEPNEIDFIVKYLSRYGQSLKVVEPEHLREHMKAYYLELIHHL